MDERFKLPTPLLHLPISKKLFYEFQSSRAVAKDEAEAKDGAEDWN
jgi:hypothetical protein